MREVCISGFGLTHEQIAAVMNVSPRTVSTIMKDLALMGQDSFQSRSRSGAKYKGRKLNSTVLSYMENLLCQDDTLFLYELAEALSFQFEATFYCSEIYTALKEL
jgi:transposase